MVAIYFDPEGHFGKFPLAGNQILPGLVQGAGDPGSPMSGRTVNYFDAQSRQRPRLTCRYLPELGLLIIAGSRI
jgi:hypothetical protein